MFFVLCSACTNEISD